MGEPSYSEILGAAIAGRGLTRLQAREAFGQIMDGKWSEAQIGAFLTALAAKGETVEEIAGAAEAMREHAVRIDARGGEPYRVARGTVLRDGVYP